MEPYSIVKGFRILVGVSLVGAAGAAALTFPGVATWTLTVIALTILAEDLLEGR